jgi:hypothetical protein
LSTKRLEPDALLLGVGLEEQDGVIEALKLVGPVAHPFDIALADGRGAHLAEDDVQVGKDLPQFLFRHLLEQKDREGGVAFGDIAAVA